MHNSTQSEGSDRHPPLQQMMHTDIIRSTETTFKSLGPSCTAVSCVAQHHFSTQKKTWNIWATHWHLLTPHQLIQSMNYTTNRANTRQLMKTGHCWQHHQAHLNPSQPYFYFYSRLYPSPTWNSTSMSYSFYFSHSPSNFLANYPCLDILFFFLVVF